ncbi:MAG: zinc ribbon domain-containing protein [Bacillota bacterium]|nr:zinc ribbon domain-containing protein [Bacillota bacterium]
MTQKVCDRCGEYNSVSAMVCSSCGSTLSRSEIIGGTKTSYDCPECGKKLETGVRTCLSCGCFISEEEKHEISYRNSRAAINPYIMGILYLTSCFIPLVGIVAAIMLLTENEPLRRKSGRVCLCLGLIPFIYIIYVINHPIIQY